MNREEVLDFIDKVFFGTNATVIALANQNNIKHNFSLNKLPKEYEDVREYLKKNLK